MTTNRRSPSPLGRLAARAFRPPRSPGRPRRPAALLAAGGLAAALLSAVAAAPAQAQSLPDTPGYSLPLALQESLYFYDAQKSGPARTDGDQPLSWRGDDAPSDSCVPLQPMADNVGTNLSASFIAACRRATPRRCSAGACTSSRRPTRPPAPGHTPWTR